MGQMINRRRYMGEKGLPYDAEIEYIESADGNQYIDTNIIPDEDTVAQIKVMNKYATRSCILGYYGSETTSWRLFNNVSKIYFDSYSGYRIIGGNNSFEANAIYEFEIGNNYVKDIPTNTILVSGNSYTGTGISTICVNGNRLHTSSNKWYYLKIYKNGVLQRDMIPVRVGITGYMYDKVSGRLFGNDGTGDFVLGPDKT